MRFTKPSWVVHKDSSARSEQSKRQSIFSVHVHPDGSRIATGGLDAKVRIWSTKPILNAASELSNRPPKSLCTLSMHTGPVLVVRWAHSGRWLASGSDDAIVMVWDLDPTARGKVWGSDEVNVEGWKPLKRLPGHESDVTDVGWSPGDRYLASVALDSQVIVWCGFTLERLHKLDQHQGFVKGVCWDPVGEFLATQSDDKTVKIWRTSDWELEAEVRKPFEESPGSTFFRRLSWSPDGAHITASNATNNKGYVFTAAVITRNTWTSEISLVGHENTVEVACYNPHIFLRDPSSSVETKNICSVVALGADDCSVSVWQTKSARPLIVAKEVFERQIMDLSWSYDGLTLYAASSDGTLAVFDFDKEELQGISPHSAQEQYLKKFGFVLPPLPEGFSHQVNEKEPSVHPFPQRSQSQTGFDGENHAMNGIERVNVLVPKKKDKNAKKRIQPMQLSSIPSASTSSTTTKPETKNLQSAQPKRLFLTEPTRNSPSLPASRMGSRSVSPPSISQRDRHSSSVFMDSYRNDTMDLDDGQPPIAYASTGSLKGKRKLGMADFGDDQASASGRVTKPRTLGGDVQREAVDTIKQIQPRGRIGVHLSGDSVTSGETFGLQTPAVLNFLRSEVAGGEDVLEGRNSEQENAPPEITFISGKQTQWLDYLPSPILLIKATPVFCAVAMQDGSVNVYSHTGRRIMPTLSLGSPCCVLEGNKNALLGITSSGQVYSWNIKQTSAFFSPTSILPIFSNSPNVHFTSACVRSNGAPIINTSNGVAHSYDAMLMAWVKLTDRWWSSGSDAWQQRSRAAASNPATIASTNVIAAIEASVGSIDANTGFWDSGSADVVRPTWWNTALTLGHLESRLQAARLLESPMEYKQALLVYAKKIADEGFRGKAEELVKELFGPIYWRPRKEDGWTSTVVGIPKRDLLKDVLSIFARSKTLTKMAQDWQDALKKASMEE